MVNVRRDCGELHYQYELSLHMAVVAARHLFGARWCQLAVAGMNCAIPSARFGLTACASKRLSCQRRTTEVSVNDFRMIAEH
jgi:hypothetical protein